MRPNDALTRSNARVAPIPIGAAESSIVRSVRLLAADSAGVVTSHSVAGCIVFF